MTSKVNELRKEIASRYSMHCGSCTGSCCTTELENEFIAFDWESDEWNETGAACEPCKSGSIDRIPFKNGRCPFSGTNACSLSIDKRPLDCLTYPVYPQIDFLDDDRKCLTGLFVRSGCHRVKEIMEDKALLDVIRLFWECQLTQTNNAAIKQWLCEITS